VDFISPSESDRFARLACRRTVKACDRSRASSLEVLRPFSVQGPVRGSGRSSTPKCRLAPGRRAFLPVSFRPRRFSRPRRLAPLRTVPRFPRVTLVGFMSFRAVPGAGDSLVTELVPPRAVSVSALPSQGLAPSLDVATSGVCRPPTVPAHLRFPFGEGSIPSWTFILWDLAPTSYPEEPPEERRPFGPVTIPD